MFEVLGCFSKPPDFHVLGVGRSAISHAGLLETAETRHFTFFTLIEHITVS